MMEPERQCPIRMIVEALMTRPLDKEGSEIFTGCLEEQCAWWLDDSEDPEYEEVMFVKGCAIKYLTMVLAGIARDGLSVFTSPE